jgi:hypothetical protein
MSLSFQQKVVTIMLGLLLVASANAGQAHATQTANSPTSPSADPLPGIDSVIDCEILLHLRHEL